MCEGGGDCSGCDCDCSGCDCDCSYCCECLWQLLCHCDYSGCPGSNLQPTNNTRNVSEELEKNMKKVIKIIKVQPSKEIKITTI